MKKKKDLKPCRKLEIVTEIRELRTKDSGKALRVLKISRSSFHYRSLKDNSKVMMELEQLTQSHQREGFWKY